jgi:hypothetical protein
MNEVEKLNAICFWLISQCLDTGAETMTIKQENVYNDQGKHGDWEIIVRRKKRPAS